MAATEGPFQGIIASGFHTLDVVWALWLRTGALGDASQGGLGIDALRWLRPVRPGDTVRARVEVLERLTREGSGRGRVVLGFSVRNQEGEEVLTFRTLCLVARRPPTGE
jgi:acyl dehydratase